MLVSVPQTRMDVENHIREIFTVAVDSVVEEVTPAPAVAKLVTRGLDRLKTWGALEDFTVLWSHLNPTSYAVGVQCLIEQEEFRMVRIGLMNAQIEPSQIEVQKETCQ